MEKVQFDHREPIGSSTYPPPNDVPVRQIISALFNNAVNPLPKSTLYIHIPFCNEICSFCGFNKAVSSEPVKERYVNALIEEIARYGRKRYVQSLDIQAVYFGGGTPNALSADQLLRILHAMNHHLPIARDAEITAEGIVQNFDDERSEALKEGGVNRISAGIQTFDRKIRETHLHMRNGADELLRGIEKMRSHFGNINLDMIYNLPGQTDEIWAEDMRLVLQTGVQHLTVYPLVLLENTIFYADYVKNKKFAAPDEVREIEMYRHALDAIAGSPFTNRYSVRDWAKPGLDCRYIRMNAESNHILALGAGSHGYLAGATYRTIRSTVKYMEFIEQNPDELPLDGVRLSTDQERMQRYAVMGLRMRDLDLAPFETRFGARFLDVFEKQVGEMIASGYLTLDGDRLHFTDMGDIWANNVRTHFEGRIGKTVGYTDTVSIGEDGKTHYSKVTRIKASGDVEANV
ncbi:coproporphyrinogen-III oxidase family protein [Rhizobium sp. RU36D]|uniref:coproporphyrinogen-III oxidase family protein n=1 Tax=Rhizobium sp. RU36D TaxID=1907415 RepID=UPI0009D8A8DC|nr:coproporphyrinogen-III oxidase family protein [Rhizobium sp. RU36D]SMD00394.1 oxygen-independent coproporphyrinogen-3 oxidase [Rhizobium sp. RU36D]